MNNYCVYMHVSPNGKKYIGITRQKPIRRWRKKGQGYKGNLYFTSAIKKYGWDNFEHKILFYELTQKEAEQKEIELIAKYKSSNYKYGYNLDNGGRTVGTLREQTKEKIRKINLGKKASEVARQNMSIAQKERRKHETKKYIKREGLKGEKNPFYGKHHTEETIKKIREKNSGRNSAWWGKKHTKEELQKISNAHKKEVEQIDNNNIVINVYASVLDASEIINCNASGIYKAIKRKSKSHNYYWRYKEDKVKCLEQ